MTNSLSLFDQQVATRYHIYNSLFLNLPFRHIYRTGTLLPLLEQVTAEGFQQGKSPVEIIEKFWADYMPLASEADRQAILFSFIQYVERQVVLFDSIEDAAFEKLNPLHGKGSLQQLFLRAQSLDKIEALKAKLETFSLRIVLTAHPTQFYPGNVLAILNDLEQAIRENDLSAINLLLQQLGKTAFVNREKPTPLDEAISLTWYLENIFFQAVPLLVKRVLNDVQIEVPDWQNPALVRIGFWPGGDRDGNPFVTSATTLQVAERLRLTSWRCYYREIRKLRRRLTFKGVYEQISAIERKLLEQVNGNQPIYKTASELETDLLAARQVLVAEHDGLFLDLLDDMLIKVKAFGFFFASMDMRQHADKHTQAVAELLPEASKGQPDWRQFQESALPADSFTHELLASLRTIPQIQALNGEAGLHRYVISNCGKVEDVLCVQSLLSYAFGQDEMPMDIVPLFETIDDLAHAAGVMEALFQLPSYRAHVARRNNRQTIMLGFSDGTKDGGYLRANWSIYQAKENLTEICRKYGIKALFFDGRGGPPARGGGNTHDFYASLPDTIESEEVQITIQGQTISSNFGKVISCQYNLEQMLSAGVEGSVSGYESKRLKPQERQLLETLAEASYASYKHLRNHDKFVPYLEKATPLRYFGETNIASRPVKRSKGSLQFEDLRAIPFVGSWAMMKQNIPGFYGLGSALKAHQNQAETLRQLYQHNLFFKTLINNSMMALSKTYYPATQYLRQDAEFAEFWDLMHREFTLSTQEVLSVTQQTEILSANPLNKASIAIREKIILPLIAIQQFALQKLRSEEVPQEVYHRLVLRCMFGIINAARNSA
ncbi:phosphoenolpyruvate carboxylase [Cytophagales bacterium LB-30]|uniref:Phosphoenolpyruvate carboxylase n=1 Tax=Shiella aurantiaca TaxID=3058365 RepID=A0ABT8F7J7_9BACT|nr:phosphoenolpyruvate carboxylase [Shiella aurantiaca]MDN4166456.1 phosphoenolpyruvate carboxylase [Shiella aurantiaca]